MFELKNPCLTGDKHLGCYKDDEDQDDAWLDRPVVKVKGKSRLQSEGPCDGEA
jgi:hypothetical protein